MLNPIDSQYHNLVSTILSKGKWKNNRTGIKALCIPAATISHDMSVGFPIISTKRIGFKLVASELEFFIKGLSDKAWLQQRGNHIWDEWCNPQKVPYGNDEESKRKMLTENDLGNIYGVIWRGKSEHQRVDQLKNIVDTLKSNPDDRRMVCSAWSPMDAKTQALHPCHVLFQVEVIDSYLNLCWYQRSCDTALGIPFNIVSYGLLLHLLARQSGYKEGTLTGFLSSVHIYQNHIESLKEQLTRKSFNLPTIKTDKFTSIFDWQYTDSVIECYQSHPSIKMEIAV